MGTPSLSNRPFPFNFFSSPWPAQCLGSQVANAALGRRGLLRMLDYKPALGLGGKTAVFGPWPDGTSRERRLKAPESRGNGRFCGPRFSQGGKRFFKSVAGQDRSTLPLRSVLGVCCWQTAPEAAAETAALSPAPALYQERPHLKQKNEHLKKKARKHAAFTRCSHEHLRKGAGS